MAKNISDLIPKIDEAIREVKKRVFGMDDVIEYAFLALFAGGHIILQGVPGTAKTRLLKAVAEVLDIPFERIQMTVDLQPFDIIGSEVLNRSTGKLEFRKGPIFTGLLLADELNRATPKTKAALLEAMAEGQVTTIVNTEEGANERTIPLPPEFTVFATQNPLEQMGTYPLAEAERDRYLFKKIVNYVDEESEIQIAMLSGKDEPLRKIMNSKDVLDARATIWENVHIGQEIVHKIVRLVRNTRPELSDIPKDKLKIGASPRASQALVRASKVFAVLRGRDYVIPRDIIELAYPVFCHRVIFENRRKEEWENILKEVLHANFKEVFEKEYKNEYSA